MTIAEPIADLQWGRGNWQDYISNWRTKDTSWMQERLILRYQTTALRNADWPSPRGGQVTYNDETKSLEMWRAATSAWVRSLMFQFLTSNKDDSAGVNLSHTGAGGKGAQFTPTSLLIDIPTTNYLAGLAVIDATGLALKVGAKTAKLSTDATALVSDSPVRAPSLVSDGVITAVGAVTAGSVSAPSATITTSLTLTGATVNGGILNGASATINAVQIGTTGAHGAGGVRADAQGFASLNGVFYGDGSSAIMRQKNPSGGALGTAFAQVTATDITLSGTSTKAASQLQIYSGRSIEFYDGAPGTLRARSGGVVYTANDPGAANFAEGALWIS